MKTTYSISWVMLVLGTIILALGVDDNGGVLLLETELDDVEEKVLFLSSPRRTIIRSSSRNFLDDASVKPESSYLTSYSPIQFITLTESYSFSESDKHLWNHR
jgi:hypothetical protein